MDKSTRDPEYGAKYSHVEKDIVEILSQQVSQLVREWRLYLYFYSTEEKRLDVLKEASSSTAKVLRNALLDSTVLKIRGMTDNHETGGNKNLSLQHLVFISEEKHVKGLRDDWKNLRDICKPIRKLSDKWIAHKDFGRALGKTNSGMVLKEITNSVVSIDAFVKRFHGDVRNVKLISMPIVGAEDERPFLWTLELGNQARKALDTEMKIKRITKNSSEYNKFSPPPWLKELDPFAGLFDF